MPSLTGVTIGGVAQPTKSAAFNFDHSLLWHCLVAHGIYGNNPVFVKEYTNAIMSVEKYSLTAKDKDQDFVCFNIRIPLASLATGAVDYRTDTTAQGFWMYANSPLPNLSAVPTNFLNILT